MKAYRINDYLHRMVEPAHREAFLRDPEASFEAAGLTEEERDLIRRRDWRGLMHYGVIFFMLEKLGAVDRRVEPAHLRRDARRDARSLPAHAQRSGRAVLGRGQGGRNSGLGPADRRTPAAKRLTGESDR